MVISYSHMNTSHAIRYMGTCYAASHVQGKNDVLYHFVSHINLSHGVRQAPVQGETHFHRLNARV